MPIDRNKLQSFTKRLFTNTSIEKLITRLYPKNHKAKPRLKHSKTLTKETVNRNWQVLKSETNLTDNDQSTLADSSSLINIESYAKNIEYCIGTVKLPVGIAGPLRVNGLFAQDDYYVPLATTEAALVASYNRGAQLITKAGGCTTIVLNDGISRSPGFVFDNLIDASKFVLWIDEQFNLFQDITKTTSKHGKLIDYRSTIEGNHVYLNFDFYTGDASGQNMTTIASATILDYIVKHSPIKPKHAFVESNLSGDKKASALSYLSVRGKKVSAEVTIKSNLIEKYLHTTPAKMVEYWRLSALGGVMSGTIGIQGHYANGLTALYLATGQDAACIAESSVGVTRLELTKDGSLYAAVTLPNIIVGTVGGGTKLPSQSVGLKILGLQGDGHVYAFAEICAANCLAGELSIMGAMCAGDFASAHERLARNKK